MTEIQKRLFAMQDTVYRDFQSKLMPTVAKEKIIGVRTPLLRKYAKELSGSLEGEQFMKCLPHAFYEEDNLHAFLIEQIGDFNATVDALDRFLPYVDNWATCDSMSPKVFARHTDELLPHIRRWMASGETYTVRYGIGMLMRHYLTEHFSDAYPRMIASIQSDEYYVNMMIAWYFATALSVRYQEILPYVTERRLSPWIHRKTIQKAVESHRISEVQKQFLRSCR